MDRRRARRARAVPQPAWRDGPLLRRHARHLLGPDAAHAPRLVATSRCSKSTSSRRSAAALRRSRSTPASRSFTSRSTCRPIAQQRELDRAARTSVALDRLVADHVWVLSPTTTWAPAIAENEDAISSIILGNSLLTARGIPVAGEYGVKNVQAMKILDASVWAGRSPSTTRWTTADDVS